MKIEELKNLKGRRITLTRPLKNSKIDKREKYDVERLPWTEGDHES